MKSNVSDHLKLMELVYIDASIKCTADVYDLRDLETIKSRVKHEGFSFLTITLPQFCADFERSLANGFVDSTCFLGFAKKKHEPIPVFLQGMVSQVFDRKTGKVITDEDPDVLHRGFSDDLPTIIESVRQICLTFKKVEFACTPERDKQAFENFLAIEQSLQMFSTPEEEASKFLAVSSVLWDNMVSDYSATKCIPKHGPGATAERVSGNGKFRWQVWHDRLEPYFPIIDNGYPLGIPSNAKELEMVSIIPEELEQPVRVITVPKTLKSPRIIAIEPCCMQFVQQGIRDYLYKKLESYWLTSGHVNFRDQTVNQRLAIDSSKTGRLATIDLSDASDRVPRDLALAMFRSNLDLMDSIDACRSTRAELPGGRIVDPLMKFASMGSALCFPVEAMYFYTICVVALLDSRNLSYNSRNVYDVSRELYVYGDDILVPSTNAVVVLDYLRKYNCKVNTNKTFVSGSFRESCGVDAFAGYEVTPTYLRQLCPENKRQSSQIISWAATANLFYKKGYWRTAQFMFNKLERLMGPLPYVLESSEAIGRTSFLGYESIGRWNRGLQRFEVKALVPRPVYRIDKLEGYGALMKCFLSLESRRNSELPSLDVSKLEKSVRHGAVTLKHRWVSPH